MRGPCILIFVGSLASSGVALAGPSIPLDRFEPAPSGDSLLVVPDARASGDAELGAGVRVSYAHKPLVMRVTAADGSERRTTVVDHQLVGHLLLAAVLGERIVLDASLPAVLSQDGEDGRSTLGDLSASDATAVGDLRLGARLTLLEQDGVAPATAFGTRLWLPTATDDFAGAEEARYAAQLIVGWTSSTWLWSATAGASTRGPSDELAGMFGSEALLQAGVGRRFGGTQVGAELVGATGMDVPWLSRNTTHLEALFSVRQELGPVSAFVGGGPGLTHGAGTPSYRLLLGADVSFELSRAARAPGPAEPTPRTGRGSELPLAPRAPEPEPRGLPDRDGDGVADGVDRCPDVMGAKSADPEQHGCPPDRDRDGVTDAADACPDEKGPRTSEPKTNGCPESVRVVGTQLVITDQVTFATGSDVLAPESSKVLEQVAGVLRDHPDIARLAVDGHTDDVGQDLVNLALSRRRAIAVVRWLVEHGVDERRLEARGFGARRPLVPERTAEARSKNRRVEFQVLKRTAEGERGWRDGPVDE